MADDGSSVAIVVAPDFGADLAGLARRMPVWVADTPANRAAAEQVRQTDPAADVTTFAVGEGDPAESRCAGILATVELHHGGCSRDPPCEAFEVIGAPATPLVRAALAGIGFAVAAEWPGGFRAVRVVAEPVPPAGQADAG